MPGLLPCGALQGPCRQYVFRGGRVATHETDAESPENVTLRNDQASDSAVFTGAACAVAGGGPCRPPTTVGLIHAHGIKIKLLTDML